jgi:DNA-binding response OmpR family regulator
MVKMADQPSANRVLIIDDDAAIRRTWTKVAEATGFEARATDDTAVVREQLAAWRPSLVILDLQMPGRDGIQLLADLGVEKCEAAVVLATGSDSRILDESAARRRPQALA